MRPSIALVALLRKHPGQVLSPTVITRHLFDYTLTTQSDRQRVRVLINRARARLHPHERIKTKRGKGYVLEVGDGQGVS